MKRNKAMRAAGGLFVATMLSTSIISGTYAKYVTEGGAQDTARVAKFGVTVDASGSLFDKNYFAVTDTSKSNQPADSTPDSADGKTLTVQSSNTENIVAPGTKSDEANPLTITVSGTPEVDVTVKFAVATSTTPNDIFLAAKDGLPDMTTAKADDTFDNASAYYPIKYTVTADIIKNSSVDFSNTTTYGTVNKTNGTATGNLSQITAVLNAVGGGTDGIYYNAGTNLATAIGSIKITWEWDFDNSSAGTYDKQDTLLGDLAAGTALAPATTLTSGTDYNLNANFDLKITVTQVD